MVFYIENYKSTKNLVNEKKGDRERSWKGVSKRERGRAHGKQERDTEKKEREKNGERKRAEER